MLLPWLVAGTLVPSMLVAWAAGFLVRRHAARWGLLDRPGGRKIHAQPTPLGGGLAIWLGVVATLGVVAMTAVAAEGSGAWLSWLPDTVRQYLPGIRAKLPGAAALLLGASVLMILGLLDDRFGLHWRIRLGVQVAVAAACVLTQGDDWQLTAFLTWKPLTWALSIAWIVAMVNSFNMLDNMDALSGGIAAIAGLVLATFLLLPGGPAAQPQLFVAGFLLVLVGAILGFLWHNRPPARLFMGDAGSYFVGFCIAAATLLATFTSYDEQMRHAILVPPCVMAVPLYDMVTVIAIRVREGRSIFEGDKSHFSHRLTELGMTRAQAVLTIYLMTGTCGLAALLLRRVDESGALIILLLVGCVLLLVNVLESTARRAKLPRS